jgi:predicted small metal-binding protein
MGNDTEGGDFFFEVGTKLFSPSRVALAWKPSVILTPRSEGGVGMAKVLHCNDLVPNCDYVAKGESEQEVLQQAAEHARTAHNLGEVTPELADKVRSAIRDEAA